jgi:hypothetical protein
MGLTWVGRGISTSSRQSIHYVSGRNFKLDAEKILLIMTIEFCEEIPIDHMESASLPSAKHKWTAYIYEFLAA